MTPGYNRLLGQKKYAEAESLLVPLAAGQPPFPQAIFLLGLTQREQAKFEQAASSLTKAARFPALRATATYELSAVHALNQDTSACCARLRDAFENGFHNVDRLCHDSHFSKIADEPAYVQLVAELRKSERLFVEDKQLIHRWLGESTGDEFGWVARRVGDLDQDGVTDFVTTAPSYRKGDGKIYVYSSKTGQLLFSRAGAGKERLGNSASAAGDVNADGIPDVLVGAPNHAAGGAAYVFSGLDGSLLLELKPENPGGQFGYKVCPVGDLDLDEHDDLLVTAITANGSSPGSGAAFIYSGRTGKQLFQLAGKATAEKFGSAADSHVQPGGTQIAIGAEDAGTVKQGGVYVFRTTAGKPELAFEIQGNASNSSLGKMFVSFPGDLNEDGIIDVYASDFGANEKANGAGQAIACSGKDGTRLLTINGSQAGEGLGTSPSDAGDVNGDGIGDLIIGAWQNRAGAVSGGRVTLHDGADGRILDTWTGIQRGDTLGFDAVGIGDVNGDGQVDFLLTSAWAFVHGPRTGRVYLVAGKNYSESR